ncbi:MAG: dihydroorotate dehydrogenase electron transfer subunit [Dehalococcoidia bacterium]|nr:dihydroorotate dehydrogenase electron transfer subunit [Dehalococcoidia bacterium]
MLGVNLMWIEAPDIATAAQPGQFITVYCEGLVLRRPFSIHQVVVASGAKQSQIAILFRVTGEGTLWFSQRQPGDKIDILGPLGKGFAIQSSSKNLLLVAGGIGIAPLVFLAQRAVTQHSITLIHGASTAAQLYPFSSKGGGEKRGNPPPLPRGVQFVPVTEDGTMGKRGLTTDLVPDFLSWTDQIYACGPLAMYKAMAGLPCHSERTERLKNLPFTSFRASPPQDKVSEESKLKKCQVSLEVRLGCGIGACYGCTIRTKTGLKQVCHDGPVFEIDDIIWEEVRL